MSLAPPLRSSQVEHVVLPLIDLVVFPHRDFSLLIGRPSSIKGFHYAMDRDIPIVFLSQKDPHVRSPGEKDLFSLGTVGKVLKVSEFSDKTLRVLVKGTSLFKLSGFEEREGILMGYGGYWTETLSSEAEGSALANLVLEELKNYGQLADKSLPEVFRTMTEVEDPVAFSHQVASYFPVSLEERQALLEAGPIDRLRSLLDHIAKKIGVVETIKKIRQNIQNQSGKASVKHYLQEQMKAIQEELRESHGEGDEVDELEQKIKSHYIPAHVQEKSLIELRKMRSMSPLSAEFSVMRNYLDWIIDLPWKKCSPLPKFSLAQAMKMLDKQHFGLDKVKEGMTDFLAAQQKGKKNTGTVLCLVGPPGVGKTSLVKSLAKAMGRKFVQVSLGGVRDESDIRGHRKTYVGSMPGRLLHGLKKAQVSNPLFLLDEVDKMGADWRGDPASALLEVFDPEQNESFVDHYLEFGYDLSKVMFVCTANNPERLPRPLLDRMEIIRVPGYTEKERQAIGSSYLLPKKMKTMGLKEEECSMTEEAIETLVKYYCREAGVRNLERAIGGSLRKAIKKLMLNPSIKSIEITKDNLEEYAGKPVYRDDETEKNPSVGITAGLAWTEVGGNILLVEALLIPGKGGHVVATGKLGDVMKESVDAAMSYVKSNIHVYGIPEKLLKTHDVHIHVPEGAIPKDGPSAGVAMLSSIASVLTGIPVRSDVAMTGEISLRGRVLPIGGLKEKLLAAHRNRIKKVLIPKDNLRDCDDIPEEIRDVMEIIPVTHAREVLDHCLVQSVYDRLNPVEDGQEDLFSDKAPRRPEPLRSRV